MTYLCTNWVSQRFWRDRSVKAWNCVPRSKIVNNFFFVILTVSIRVKTQHIVLIPYLCVSVCYFVFMSKYLYRYFCFFYDIATDLMGWFHAVLSVNLVKNVPDSLYLSFGNRIVWKNYQNTTEWNVVMAMPSLITPAYGTSSKVKTRKKEHQQQQQQQRIDEFKRWKEIKWLNSKNCKITITHLSLRCARSLFIHDRRRHEINLRTYMNPFEFIGINRVTHNELKWF